jgi:hypothetical protein
LIPARAARPDRRKSVLVDPSDARFGALLVGAVDQ